MLFALGIYITTIYMINKQTNTNTHTHTHTYTYIHTYIHTYTEVTNFLVFLM
jgi:hypothetical protein